ncbi:UDP-N-acetylmuramoyl-L-alanine--D-glutamate ligase [Mycoplasmatota bacterium]|nr:UDP-N-acetylmuramoyl-L-alanine--D-glutamate ligase [Mycoplasmatota bacterium]
MIEFNNKKILVLGLKKSGKGAIRLLKTLNVEIFVSDEKTQVEEEFLEGTQFIPYDEVIHHLPSIDIIIKSPGIPHDIDILKKAKHKKVLIISEIELAYHFIDKSKVIVAITGTNGKTTTTALITQILLDSNIEAVSVGNIGYTLSDAIVDEVSCDVFILELSSFQLLDIIHFKPHIGVILNLAEAHLDYHHTFDHYVDAKMNLVKQMKEDCYLIYNADDKIVRKKVKKIKCSKYAFSLSEIDVETYIENDVIKYNGRSIVCKDEVKLLGKHNLYNVLAAITTAKVFYIENDIIKNTIKTFESLPHRIQFVKKINGVTYYNDSKSTNVNSTLCALNSFNQPVILILGGLDRGQDFSEIINHKNTQTIITYGQTKDKIVKSSTALNKTCYVSDDLLDIINLTQKIKNDEMIVLFSPASASWDQFQDYEERGDKFIEHVNRIDKE